MMLLMMPLGQLFTLPLSGKLVTKYGSSKILSILCLVYVFLLFSISLATSKYQLGAILLLFGISSNLCNISVNTQAIGVEKLYKGKSIMTTFHGGWSLAGFTGALIGLITLQFSIPTFAHFLIITSLIILNTLINKKHLIPVDSKAEDVENAQTKFKPDSLLIQLGIVGFFSMATEGAMFDWSGVYFQEIVQAPTKFVILGYTAFMIMMATGRFVGDYAITKLGTRKVLIISGLLMSFGMIVAVLLPLITAATVGFMMVGIGVACCVPTVYSLAGNHPTIPAGMALAIVTSISFLGFLLGPPIIGFIAEILSLQWSFALFSLFGICMIIIVMNASIFRR